MTHREARQRGVLLVELLAAVALCAVVAALLGKMLIDVLALQSAAAQHANRMAVMDAAVRQMRRDLLAATGCERDGAALVLTLAGAEGPQRVRWTVAPEVLRRVRADGEDREWRAMRLKFAARFAPGPRGDLLTIDFIEARPPHPTAVPNRIYPTTFLLPRGGPAAAGEVKP